MDTERRSRREPPDVYPPGAIQALFPLMVDVFNLYGVDQEPGFWEAREEQATLTFEEACVALNDSNISPLKAARAIIDRDPLIGPQVAHGHVSRDAKNASTSDLAWRLLSLYPEESRPKWEKELQKAAQNQRR